MGAKSRTTCSGGSGYTVRVQSGTGYTVSGNRVERDRWADGPVGSECGAITWTDNRLVSVGADGQPTTDHGALACG
jgi:hypothetical protein